MNICYVTSYYDIGRDSWDGFTRTFDEYLRDFEPFIICIYPSHHKAAGTWSAPAIRGEYDIYTIIWGSPENRLA